MTRAVIKPIADQDRYVVWSTVVDSFLAGGTRDQVQAYVASPSGMNRGADGAAELMARVDEFGTSIKQDPDCDYQWKFGEWSDTSFVYEQIGSLPRAHMYPMFCHLLEGRERAALDLLEAFEPDPNDPDDDMHLRLQRAKDRLGEQEEVNADAQT